MSVQPETTEGLWKAFTAGGVMIHCIRYGERDRRYCRIVREPLESEIITFPDNVPLVSVPPILVVEPVSMPSDPIELARRNAIVACRALRTIVRQTGLRFRFSGDSSYRAFVFEGANPTVLVEPEESVRLDGLPVTVKLSVLRSIRREANTR